MNASTTMLRVGLLSAALALAMLSTSVSAQEMDHSKMNMPAKQPTPAPKAPVVKKAATKPATRPAPAARPAPAMDHSKMQMQMPMPAAKPAAAPGKPALRKPAAKPVAKPTAKPAAAMDHSAMQMPMPAEPGQGVPMDHSRMGDQMAAPPPGTDPSMQGMDHSAMPGMSMAPTDPITPIPALTEADRAAAVPPSLGHTVHDNAIQSFAILDRLEGWNADQGTGLQWDGLAWFGTDLNRLWLRSEGERVDGRTESADLEALYGRSIATWWDVVVGLRHDFKPGASQDFLAIGVIGLAPQKFEVEATAYIGERGQTAARFEAAYDLLLTNRLVLQPLIEANVYGKDDPQRGIGSGLSTVEAGFRLRYEIIREFAPYIGIVRGRAFGGTADLRRFEGEDIDDTRLVAGVRIWF